MSGHLGMLTPIHYHLTLSHRCGPSDARRFVCACRALRPDVAPTRCNYSTSYLLRGRRVWRGEVGCRCQNGKRQAAGEEGTAGTLR